MGTPSARPCPRMRRAPLPTHLRAVEESKAHGGESYVRDLAVLEVAHGLVDAVGQREEGARQGRAVGDVA
eukprot:7272431-Alexandrium_andersonii.AAC.1